MRERGGRKEVNENGYVEMQVVAVILFYSSYFIYYCDIPMAGAVKLVVNGGERRGFNGSCAGWLSVGRRVWKIDSASCGSSK